MKYPLLLTAISMLAATAQAQVPAFMSYQGRVTDSSGNGIGSPSPVNRKVIFRIFDHPTAGARVWSEAQTVTLSNGEFSVMLGQGEDAVYSGTTETPRPGLAAVFAGGTERYLELVVDNGDGTLNSSDAPISPRQRLLSTAFAFRAQAADSIAPGSTLQLNGSPDNGLGWYGAGRPFNGTTINGPVLFGAGGGALGSVAGASQTTALRWDGSGNVGIGTTSPAAGFRLDVAGPMKGTLLRLDGGVAPPENSDSGGVGMRLVLWPGTAGTATPFGFGINGSTLYSVVPASAHHRWFGGTTEQMSLSGASGQLSVSGGVSTPGNVTASGSVSAAAVNSSGNVSASGVVMAAGSVTSHVQGAYIEWNKGGNGATYLLNQKGLGTGGFVLGEVTTDNVITESVIFPANGGIVMRGGFGAETAYGGNTGNFISFAQPGFSEDYMGYAGNTFYFRDSPGGGDGTQPGISVGADVTAGGNVAAGGNVTANGKTTIVGEETLRIVRGSVARNSEANFTTNDSYSSPDGTKLKGSGYSFKRLDYDRFEITFATAFSDPPTVTVTPKFTTGDNFADNSRVFMKIYSVSTTKVEIRNNADDGDRGHEMAFDFIAIGPR